MNTWQIVVSIVFSAALLQVTIHYLTPLYKKHFQRKPKVMLLDNTYRIVEAFEWKGTTYYMHEDPLNTATGRGLTSMLFMEELLMRCSLDYLRQHTDACEEIFTDPERIDLPKLIRLNTNLKERIGLLGALPEHVFKLASIVYFTKEESPFRYDQAFNRKKIEAWEKEPGMYDFFCQGHLGRLMPFLQLEGLSSEKFLQVAGCMNEMHLKDLRAVLSRKA